MADKYNRKTIKLNDRFSLCYDDRGDKWLVENKISEKGKKYDKVYCGYHWHFDYLLECFVRTRMPEKEAATIKGALKALADAEQEMIELTKTIGKELDEAWTTKMTK